MTFSAIPNRLPVGFAVDFLGEVSVIALSLGRIRSAVQGKVSAGTASLQPLTLLLCVLAPHSVLLLLLTLPS
jgi:hypothetical protein